MSLTALDAFLGLAVGDALGVPVEFRSRSSLKANPVTGMRDMGTHMQPAGTWSDDSSLSFCLAESLCKGFDPEDIGKYFISWYKDAEWTAHDRVFDIGITTREAIHKLERGVKAELAGGLSEHSNGNGSLMRILPLLFYTHDLAPEERYQRANSVSSITHGHIRSVISCFYYLEFARCLLSGKNPDEAYRETGPAVLAFLNKKEINQQELGLFSRLFESDISALPEAEINSSGYVLHTLEASIWCVLTTNDYKSAVLKAVNLGDDTDTTGAVTGGLAGLYYGYETIPSEWLQVLAKKTDITNLAARFTENVMA